MVIQPMISFFRIPSIFFFITKYEGSTKDLGRIKSDFAQSSLRLILLLNHALMDENKRPEIKSADPTG